MSLDRLLPINILGIESSCDETAVGIVSDAQLKSNIVAGQAIHAEYGGVVPEFAARAHSVHILSIVEQALTQAGMQKEQLTAIAFTQGPGLLGPLLVGNGFAKGLSFALNIPLVGVHHIRAHVLANFIDEPKPTFPFLCLTVSGGHTQILLVHGLFDMTILGQTQDDAVGEAFDKMAKLMGLPYPGGALINRYAKKGHPKAFSFPNTQMPALDFSFSGIKSAFARFIENQSTAFILQHRADICASIQDKLVEMLMEKLVQAAEQTHIKTIALAGGVAANTHLRQRLISMAEQLGWHLFMPDLAYCTDNGAMVAMAGYYQYCSGQTVDLAAPSLPRMRLSE